MIELENLTTLQALATKINNDAVAAAQPNPNYQAYLVEGNDVGGIDVGFLVKTPRVTVIDVVQEGKTTMWLDPSDNAMHLLNDRPPLVLRATVDGFAVTVIVNHLRSFLGIESNDPAGLTTEGNRVRQKRKAQAEWLADLVQDRQVADPTERIVLVGDFNAFQFNDGYVDVMGTIKGTPVPANEVVVSTTDLVSPDLVNLVEAVASGLRYSYAFEGNAQVLDHILVTSNANAQLFYARNDADFPETFRNDPNQAGAYFGPRHSGCVLLAWRCRRRSFGDKGCFSRPGRAGRYNYLHDRGHEQRSRQCYERDAHGCASASHDIRVNDGSGCMDYHPPGSRC